ncbi:MAG: protein-L-isoaspartate carboxylmethyltransferase, partial [Marmoricola sp.]
MDPVAAAFAAVPRAAFLPRRARARASYDGPIQIGHGQTNSQPSTVVAMLRLLGVETGHRVLDVGAGSGWTTALTAQLTGPTGWVLGLEIVPELVTLGVGNLAGAGCPWASIEPADPGSLGAPDRAPFDRILVSANARSLPAALVDQLADPGRMVIPVASVMVLVVKDG